MLFNGLDAVILEVVLKSEVTFWPAFVSTSSELLNESLSPLGLPTEPAKNAKKHRAL